MTDFGEQESPIETYLDAVVAGLTARSPRQLRHVVAETEAHLRDDAEQAMAAGMPAHEAEAQAVHRFGPAREFVAAERARAVLPIGDLARRVLTSALLLGGLGAVAVGASGVIAALIRLVAGTQALVDVAPGRVLSASDCARWLAADPGARSCREAALSDWAAETVVYRIALGLLGGLALVALGMLRRRATPERWAPLPRVVSDTIALTIFGTAGCWTLGLGVDAIVGASGHGAGQWLSAAPVALAAAAIFGWRLLRDLRGDPQLAYVRSAVG
ncbi:MAG: hypothetical protein DLM57_01365 [Pseudonocardiales bacterium]|nr:MAG: hypothetical protein DLM57_01365 [Pseudonocardiales bacterium]